MSSQGRNACELSACAHDGADAVSTPACDAGAASASAQRAPARASSSAVPGGRTDGESPEASFPLRFHPVAGGTDIIGRPLVALDAPFVQLPAPVSGDTQARRGAADHLPMRRLSQLRHRLRSLTITP